MRRADHDTYDETYPLSRWVLWAAFAAAFGCAAPGGELGEAERRQRMDELYRGDRKAFPGVPEVSAEELAELLRTGDVVLVDVREDDERRVSTIPGALSKAELERDAESYRGRRVVTYCTIGYRSGLYAAELRRRGFDAWNLSGSVLAWTHAGGPLVDEDGRETRRVHVYGAKWNLAADGYETLW